MGLEQRKSQRGFNTGFPFSFRTDFKKVMKGSEKFHHWQSDDFSQIVVKMERIWHLIQWINI